MTRIITAIFFCYIISLQAIAAGARTDYEIINLNTPTIKIGGKELKVHDRFDERAKIEWANDNQSLEAKNLSTGKYHRFSAKTFRSKWSCTSIADFIAVTTKGSTRGSRGKELFTRAGNAASYPERRLALVIGNSNYASMSYLRNAQKDASDLASTLGSIGFDVIENYECDYDEMCTALISFVEKAPAYDVALFYFSGHGIEDQGHNYLIPVDAAMRMRSELLQCLSADDVLDRMEQSGVAERIILLDACRDAKKMWSRDANQGLARMEGAAGTAIMFSTSAGHIAFDGDGDNSPFAQAILTNITQADTPFPLTISNIVRDTYRATSQRQTPQPVGTLMSDFRFNGQRPTQTNDSIAAQEYLDKGWAAYKRGDFKEAFYNYKQAAELGNKESQWAVGLCYCSGTGTEVNYEEAFKWLKKAADQGFAEAMTNIGGMYENGNGVDCDYAMAMKWYKDAAELGSANGMSNIGGLYFWGKGVKKDYTKALEYFNKAADKNNMYAQKNLGVMYENGFGVNKDMTEAIKWYIKSAEQGNTDAQFRLGSIYYNGLNVSQDYSESLKWYTLAAQQGNVKAQHNIAVMYRDGQGTPINIAEAIKWYRKAAEQGHAASQYTLGIFYFYGNGVEQNYQIAFDFFSKAAEQGLDEACFALGSMYENGEGVPRNISKALEWYKKAGHHPQAQERIEAFGK